MSKHLIFVYGTLKSGWGNNIIIADQKLIIPNAKTYLEWQMYSLGGFPGVVRGNRAICGEVWEVDDEAFQRCDQLEGHPSFYKRELVNVTDDDCIPGHERWTKAWMYIYQCDIGNCKELAGWYH